MNYVLVFEMEGWKDRRGVGDLGGPANARRILAVTPPGGAPR
jgi:hypothetical protein